MEEGFDYDLDELLKKIETAEALSVFFPKLRKAVVVDIRFNDRVGPMIRILPMVASLQERLRTIRRLRPGFPRLRTMSQISWPRYVDSLVKEGIWDKIAERVKHSGYSEAIEACGSVLEELRRLERAELTAVVRGENYHTIWSARSK